MFAAIAEYTIFISSYCCNAKSVIGTFTTTLILLMIGDSVKLLKNIVRRLWT